MGAPDFSPTGQPGSSVTNDRNEISVKTLEVRTSRRFSHEKKIKKGINESINRNENTNMCKRFVLEAYSIFLRISAHSIVTPL